MALNYIWVGFFIVAFIVALIRLIFFQDMDVFPEMMKGTFDSAKTGFELSLGLTGVMTLWLGLMKIGERGGAIPVLSRLVGPFFARLFPEIPRNHPATGSIIMNFSANILGLDNAATPLGLKAMKDLQEINPDKDTASNAQIMFLVLNASGLTIIPLSILADRVSLGSVNPTSIFIPTLIATSFSTLAGLLYVCIRQKINLFDRVLLSYVTGIAAFIGLSVWYFNSLTADELQKQSLLFSSLIILSIIMFFIGLGLRSKIPMFETFVDGAKEGFETAIKIIPFLVAFLVAVGIFRKSGAFDYLLDGVRWTVSIFTERTEFVDALPVGLMKPLSGGLARGLMMDISKTFGVDSFAGNLASVFRGCAETTFYVLALYFGSVNIRKSRYAVTGGLIADLFGIIGAIFAAYLFFF
ncbi:MAG TPA: nucleoside recognition domain-containing protein [Chryseosolibacter sp.]